MKHFFVRTSFALAALVALTGSVFAQPKLQIGGGGTHDWGTVTDVSKPLVAKVELKNIGTQELNISEVKPGCGCTAAMPQKTKLAAGEATMVDVSLNIGSNAGQLMKTISVTTNAPTDPTQTIILKAFIIRPVSVDPQFVVMPPMFVGKEVSSAAKLRNNLKVPITLTAVTPTAGIKTNLKMPMKLAPGEQVEMTMTITPTEEQKGYYGGSVVVQTDNNDMKSVDIRLYGDVKVLTPAQSPAFNQQQGGSGGGN